MMLASCGQVTNVIVHGGGAAGPQGERGPPGHGLTGPAGQTGPITGQTRPMGPSGPTGNQASI
jgi:hypothetical protein